MSMLHQIYVRALIPRRNTVAKKALATDAADFIVFSRPFIANPDLPYRLSANLPLSSADPATFYGGGLKGYSDYAAYVSTSA